MSLSLSNLIDHVGLEHIKVQTIDGSVVSAKAMKSGDVRLTFATQQYRVRDAVFPDKAEMFGLVVWLPRDRLPKTSAK